MKTTSVYLFTALLVLLVGLSACNIDTIQPGAEPTQTVMLVHVDELVEYRTGPGEVYEVIGTLPAGQEVEVIGMSPDGSYWLFAAPGDPQTHYWLDAASVTVVGVVIAMPIATPPPTPTLVGSGCPSPVPSGPTPVSCEGYVPPPASGCPSPVPSGPTPVSCAPYVPPPGSGCPSPVPSGPTPVSCGGGGGGGGSGCPSPVPSGPTPISCSPFVPPPPSGGSGCPSPVPSGPTPVSCP